MRGQVLLASTRTPYMRAGLAWASREALRLDIRELDGERLHELLGDPVVTVSIGGDNGVFKPLASMLVAPVTADVLQLMIDAIAEDLPPIGEPIEASEDSAGVEIMARLRDAGWLSAEDAIAELAKLRADAQLLTVVLLNADVETLDQLLEKHREQLKAGNADLERVVGERNEARDTVEKQKTRIADLEAAAAKQPVNPTTKKPKPTTPA